MRINKLQTVNKEVVEAVKNIYFFGGGIIVLQLP
jgi:hypothetical protein